MRRVARTQVFSSSLALSPREATPAQRVADKDVPAAHAKFWAFVAAEMAEARWFRVV